MPRLYKNLYVLTRWIGTAAQATGLAHDFSDSYASRSLSYAARTSACPVTRTIAK